MIAEAIYFGCWAIVAFTASAVFFKFHEDFKRYAGFLPPKIVYGHDYLGMIDKSNIVWKTPTLNEMGWTRDQAYEMMSFLWFAKWVTPAVGLFMLATALIKWFTLK